MENKHSFIQEQQVLNHLQENGYITKLNAMDTYCITNLGEKIRALRKKGYNIKTLMECNQNTKTVYAKYYLLEEGQTSLNL